MLFDSEPEEGRDFDTFEEMLQAVEKGRPVRERTTDECIGPEYSQHDESWRGYAELQGCKALRDCSPRVTLGWRVVTTPEQDKIRLEKKCILVTATHCGRQPRDVLGMVVEAERDKLEWAICASEHHEDGDLHIHLLLLWKDKNKHRGTLWFMTLFGATDDQKHWTPNLQAIKGTNKDIAQARKYLTKEEGRYCWWNTTDPSKDEKFNKKGMLDKAVASIQEGATMEELIREPEMGAVIVRHYVGLNFYIDGWINATKHQLKEWPTSLFGNTPEERIICGFLLESVRKNRPPKSPQLWLHGPPNVGKSRLIHWLYQFLRVWRPTNEVYHNGYNDRIDIVVWDEVMPSSCPTLSLLNTMADGYKVALPVKQGPPTLKNVNQPCLVCSNYRPEEIYTKVPPQGMAALRARFRVLEVHRVLDPETWLSPTRVEPAEPRQGVAEFEGVNLQDLLETQQHHLLQQHPEHQSIRGQYQ